MTVKLLLNTHVLLWWLDDHKALPSKTLTTITKGENIIFVSAATAWEISIKQALGKLKAPSELVEALEVNRFLHLPITVYHSLAAGKLPRYHDDPFDRMLIAQAQIENLTFITHDPHINRYAIPILWK